MTVNHESIGGIEMQDLIPQEDNNPTSRRGDGAALMRELAEGQMSRVSDVIAGKANEIDVDDVMFAVEFVTPLMRTDHMRLLRAASVAIQYYRVNPAGYSEPSFLKRVAATCQVDPEELSAYALVLQREIRYREKTGTSPLTDLPRLINTEDYTASQILDMLPIAPPTRFKHDPSEYVELAEQGLNNTEIARCLGDVSEAAVRRGLAAAGYERGRSSAGADEQ